MTKEKHIRLKVAPQVVPVTGAGGQRMSERIAFTPVVDAEENEVLRASSDQPIAPQPLFTLPVSDPKMFGAFEGVQEVTLDFKVTKRAPVQREGEQAQAPKQAKAAKPQRSAPRNSNAPMKASTRAIGPKTHKSHARRLVSVKRK